MLHHVLRDPNKAQLSFHIHNHLLAISFSGRSVSNTGNFRFSSCIQKADIQVQLYHDEVREAREVSFELSLDQVSEGLQILLTLFLSKEEQHKLNLNSRGSCPMISGSCALYEASHFESQHLYCIDL
ncbi:uncharacterized protein EV154DRAFT_484366 [Mucor mucedo]|uniref:uncharacterized protein n=1 Tax=Mucor mucedo TaxID=29922 RepID=UPI00221F06D9|nr:uncharacterized protein EV154DRAFT_484366 [Mucor mucedo]KAI7888171.1 hypothetical protein EV154DRAFT_484366 [Mucor mucedo]